MKTVSESIITGELNKKNKYLYHRRVSFILFTYDRDYIKRLQASFTRIEESTKNLSIKID